MSVDVWVDFACPACYLAKPRLDAAVEAASKPVTLRLRAWQLFPQATSEPFDSFEYVVTKFGGDTHRAQALEDDMSRLARAQNQPYLVHHPIGNSVDAHRVIKLAAVTEDHSKLFERFQSDLFGGGLDVYQADYLISAAADLGIPPRRTRAVLDSDEYLEDVHDDEARGRAAGLTGVPFAVFDDHTAIAGAASVADYLNAIEASAARSHRS